MPKGLDIYSQVFPSLTPIGALADAASVSIQHENKDVDIETIFKGFAGTTPSPDKISGSVELFDPVSGSIYTQLLGIQKARSVETLTLTSGSGETAQYPVYIRNVQRSSAVGDPAKISFDFVGRPSL